ncbi:DNA adenine methylase [Microbispora sp. ZYX-F-249]|uniref:site-specific DNA-methyltransferase (adenine-specific) n=1 Tax=Microbispora maris TaxID=3144104 RepID=A0ABV0ARG5_9ACTN
MRYFYISPLRYPGGKAALADFFAEIISSQGTRITTFVEPFAGGAGAALRLLYTGRIKQLLLNDANPGIAAFWRSVFWHTDELNERLRSCELSIDAWHHYRAVYDDPLSSEIELAFATLYLNRTNRSGILGARPIGGLRQDGKWKIDARFNRQDLIDRITILGQYRDRVQVSQSDALEFLESTPTRSSFFYVDPPYLGQGDELYLNTLQWADHLRLANILHRRHRRWVVTYDADPRIPSILYPGLRCAEFSIKHTAARQQIGSEYAVFSDKLTVDSIKLLSRGYSAWLSDRADRDAAVS